jgi:2-methylisocitrate lyase-like PEP mutase family enzyme
MALDMDVQRRKAESFLALHPGPRILVLPNAFDPASARILEEAGFAAIATTSSGIAQTLGVPDGQRIGRDEMVSAVRRIARSVQIPVTADLEAGYGPGPLNVAEAVRRAIDAGAIGANLEDGTGNPSRPLFDLTLSIERITAAREAANAARLPFVLNARTDGFIAKGAASKGVFEDAVRRANAYLQAGASCAFVPAVSDAETIGRLVQAVDGPLNILAGPTTPSVPELEALGVARVSVGGSLARASLTVVKLAAQELLERGTYTFARDAITAADVARLLER